MMLQDKIKDKRAFLFDLDGTLVDSMWIWRDIDIQYLGRFGIQLPEDLQSCIEGMSFSETAQYFKARFSIPDTLEQMKDDWNRMAWDKYLHEVGLKAGVGEFLAYYRNRGVKMAIATSNSRELVTAVVEAHGLTGYFDTIVTGCDVAHGKPSPDIYLEAAARLGVCPEECLVFEDIVPGIQAGRNAGMTVVAVEDAYSLYQERQKKELADLYIANYTEFLPKTEHFLPICRQDMTDRGIEQLDFVYVIGDAYVDHPSFGHAIISRVLEAHGYTVGIIAQPDWKDEASIRILGRPRLAFLISAGNMDSCVNHYSVSKKRRGADAYTPGGVMGKRPDHATVVYGNLIRKSYRDVPIIIGGIEASLRRMAHYDYWTDSFKRSILLDSQADLISYGMGEKSIVEIADALGSGIAVRDITFIPGTVYKTKDIGGLSEAILLPSYEEMKADKTVYARSFGIQYQNTDYINGRILAEPYPGGSYVVQNPPQPPLTMQEMDDVYALPYARTYHPSYEEAGGVPAIAEIKFSLISNRGCFGGCSFCALTFHQGRTVQTRSHESILEEAKLLTREPDFKGYIHDVGGPTANFRHPSCQKQLTRGVCQQRQCLFPKPCANLQVDHSNYLELLRKLRSLEGVKKVFVRSGIRFDYLMADADDTFFRELVEHHVSGQLKVAPEHISDAVLRRMGKPENAVYERFVAKYKRLNKELGKNQFLVPYLMSSHPGSTLKEAIELAEYLRDLGYMPEQVQDFYPTPSTISTVMYYTGLDPRGSNSQDLKPVYVCRNPHEKAMQRALIQYRNPKNYDLVYEALTLAGRTDLIGYDKKCLIRPKKAGQGDKRRNASNSGSDKTMVRKPGKAAERTSGKAASRNSGKTEWNAADKSAMKTPGNTVQERGRTFGGNGKRKTIRNIHKKKGG